MKSTVNELQQELDGYKEKRTQLQVYILERRKVLMNLFSDHCRDSSQDPLAVSLSSTLLQISHSMLTVTSVLAAEHVRRSALLMTYRSLTIRKRKYRSGITMVNV